MSDSNNLADKLQGLSRDESIVLNQMRPLANQQEAFLIGLIDRLVGRVAFLENECGEYIARAVRANDDRDDAIAEMVKAKRAAENHNAVSLRLTQRVTELSISLESQREFISSLDCECDSFHGVTCGKHDRLEAINAALSAAN